MIVKHHVLEVFWEHSRLQLPSSRSLLHGRRLFSSQNHDSTSPGLRSGTALKLTCKISSSVSKKASDGHEVDALNQGKHFVSRNESSYCLGIFPVEDLLSPESGILICMERRLGSACTHAPYHCGTHHLRGIANFKRSILCLD